MDKEMLAMVTFKEGTFDKFMGWFQSEEGLEIRKTIAHVEQTRPGIAPDKSYAMMKVTVHNEDCLLYTSPSPRDRQKSRMPSSA